MHLTEYVRVIDNDTRYRVRFETEGAEVRSFVVQLEFMAQGRWLPVIRYDTAHGFAHCDRYAPDGTASPHEPMSAPDYNQALTRAVREIRTQWEKLVSEFRESYQ